MTKRLTLKTVSKAVSEAVGFELELVQGNGYLYFAGTDNTPSDLDPSGWYSSSVAVCRLNHLPLERWIQEAKDLIVGGGYGMERDEIDAAVKRMVQEAARKRVYSITRKSEGNEQLDVVLVAADSGPEAVEILKKQDIEEFSDYLGMEIDDDEVFTYSEAKIVKGMRHSGPAGAIHVHNVQD